MKKIASILTVLLLSIALVGGASAFTYDNPATVSDSDSLVPGDMVSASITIKLPNGGDGCSLTFLTDLGEDAKWSGGMYTSTTTEGTTQSNTVDGYGSEYSIPEWVLDNGKNTPITISITVSGKVPEMSAGKDIYIMSITQTPPPVGSTEVADYNTGKQHVYDPNDFDKETALIEEEIAKLRNQLPIYQNYSITVTAAAANLDKASGEITNARSAHSRSDNSEAFKHLENAQNLIKEARISIASYAIPIIESKYNSINEIANTLVEKGKTSEAAILKSDNGDLKIEYDKLHSAFKTGGVPDVYDTLVKAENLKNNADKYYEDAVNPLGGILGYWWVLLIIAAAVIVVAGVVLIIKRRRDDWDELG